MEYSNTKFKLVLIMAGFLAFTLSAFAGFLLSQPVASNAIPSVGRLVPELWLDVSPNGYPSAGNEWKIFVYDVSINQLSKRVVLTPAPNSTIEVNVRLNGFGNVYSLLTDSNGEASFPFRVEYTDVAFKASFDGKTSPKLVLSEHYLSSDVLDSLSTTNSIQTALTLVSFSLTRKRITNKLIRFAYFILLSATVAVIFLSFYSRMCLRSPWGYPEQIVGDFITVALLRNITMFCTLPLLAFLIFYGVHQGLSGKKHQKGMVG